MLRLVLNYKLKRLLLCNNLVLYSIYTILTYVRVTYFSCRFFVSITVPTFDIYENNNHPTKTHNTLDVFWKYSLLNHLYVNMFWYVVCCLFDEKMPNFKRTHVSCLCKTIFCKTKVESKNYWVVNLLL